MDAYIFQLINVFNRAKNKSTLLHQKPYQWLQLRCNDVNFKFHSQYENQINVYFLWKANTSVYLTQKL